MKKDYNTFLSYALQIGDKISKKKKKKSKLTPSFVLLQPCSACSQESLWACQSPHCTQHGS